MKKIAAVLCMALALCLFDSRETFAAEKESAFDRVMRTGTIRCGIIPWPPGAEVDPVTREIRGPTRDLFDSIIRLTGWKPEFVEVTLGEVPLDLEHGKIDAMCADGPWTITNIKFVDYTTWAGYTPVLVYIRENETRYKNYSDLDAQNVSFVGIDGDVSSDLAGIRFPRATLRTLVNLTDPAQMMMEVAGGKADAVVLDPVTAEGFMKNNPGKIKPFPEKEPLAVYPFGMSVRRGEARLQQTLSRATEMAIDIGLVDQKLDLYDPTRRIVYSPLKPYRIGK